MAIPVTTVDATGVHLPAFEDVRAGLVSAYQGIYGSDVVLDNDTQDGQWLAIVASAINDANMMAAAVYNAFSPSTAQGAGLSSIVKTNGIAPAVATYSTADLRIVGQAGTIILGGLVSDAADYRWALPPSVTIPLTGEITVTATCTTLGAITASVGEISAIATPTAGWQSATNLAAATPGAPVETDAALRRRQAISTAIPSRSLMDGIDGGIAAIPGVTRFRGYENDTDGPDPNGIPGHTLAYVVEGGDAAAIASVIAGKKGAGVGTYGTTSVTVTSASGVPRRINFFRPSEPQIAYAVQVKAQAGYTTNDEAALKQALSDWTNAQGIGISLDSDDAFVAAKQDGNASGRRYKIVSFAVARDAGTPTVQDIAIAFYEAAACSPDNVTVTYA